MEKDNDIISFSKYLFFNGIINEDGIKSLFEQFIKHSKSKKHCNLVSFLIEYFQLMKKSRKKLVGFSKYIYIKFFESDNKIILNIFKKLLLIYSSKKKKLLLKYLLKWREKLYFQLIKHTRNFSTISNSESNNTIISKTSVDLKKQKLYDNDYFTKNLIERKSKNKLNSHIDSEGLSHIINQKTLHKNKTSKQILNKNNSKFNLPLSKKNNENPKVISNRQANYVSPKSSKHKINNKANMGFKERIFVYSNRKKNSICFESPLKTPQDHSAPKRHDYLYNLHKQKNNNLKKLEENIKIENGITFKPKLNTKSSNKSISNLIKHTRTDSLPKYDFINIYNSYINTCSPKFNKSFSQKNLVRSYETSENTNLFTNDILKTKESYLNNDPYIIHNFTKESISTICKNTNEVFNSDSCIASGFISKKNSVLNDRKLEFKAKFKHQNKSNFLSENESLTNYRSETNTSSFKPDELKIQNYLSANTGNLIQQIECIDDIQGEAYSNFQTDTKEIPKNRVLSSRIHNPFNIDNCNDKEILEMANNYITTDESLDNYQNELNKENNKLGIRYNLKKRNQNKYNENFSFKNNITKEKNINSSNSQPNNQISTNYSNRMLQESIQQALKFYKIANN